MSSLRLCLLGGPPDALATLLPRLPVTVVPEAQAADVYLLLEGAESAEGGAFLLPFGRSAAAEQLSPPDFLADRWPQLLEASEEALEGALSAILQRRHLRRELPEPTPRHKATLKRRLRRDEWNQQARSAGLISSDDIRITTFK